MMHKFICLIVMTLSIAACAHNSPSDQANILKPNPNLQLSEVRATATKGQNYVYCFNCLPNNLQEISKQFALETQSQAIAQMVKERLEALENKNTDSINQTQPTNQQENSSCSKP